MYKIPIVFCFDNNFATPASVAILSLVKRSSGPYSIYCIVDKDVTEAIRHSIAKIVTSGSEITFIDALSTHNGAYSHRGITTASYYRLQIPKLLPNLNKVIYCDVDVLFNAPLIDLFNIDLDGFLLGAVKNLYMHQTFDNKMKTISYWPKYFGDSKELYFNAGVLLMNLKEIRSSSVEQQWAKMATKDWEFHDQDILNYSCKNKIRYLPPKYNASYPIRAKGASKWTLFSQKELHEDAVIYHFTASKPWNSKHISQADVWWTFLFNEDKKLYTQFYDSYIGAQTFKIKINRYIRRCFQIANRLTKGNYTKRK